MKQCAIISYKHGIYKLPHKLPNDLRLRKLGNIRKVLEIHRIIAYNSGQNIWNKIEKSSKTGSDKKSLISTFECFF